jgi:hypothetical protein
MTANLIDIALSHLDDAVDNAVAPMMEALRPFLDGRFETTPTGVRALRYQQTRRANFESA